MRWVKRVSGIACFVAGAGAGFLFWDHYWRRRDCFNELGRCYDPATATVYQEQAGIAWAGLTLLLLGLAIALLRSGRRNR